MSLVKMMRAGVPVFVENEGIRGIRPAGSETGSVLVKYHDATTEIVDGTTEEVFAALLGRSEKYRTDAEIFTALDVAFVDLAESLREIGRFGRPATEISSTLLRTQAELLRRLKIKVTPP